MENSLPVSNPASYFSVSSGTDQIRIAMKKLFLSLLFILSYTLTAQTANPCYSKIVLTDSITALPKNSIQLSKPTTLMVTDSYRCSCAVQETSLLLIRGKRPLVGPIQSSGYSINTAALIERFKSAGITLQTGDRLMLEIPKIINDKGENCKLIGTVTIDIVQ